MTSSAMRRSRLLRSQPARPAGYVRPEDLLGARCVLVVARFLRTMNIAIIQERPFNPLRSLFSPPPLPLLARGSQAPVPGCRCRSPAAPRRRRPHHAGRTQPGSRARAVAGRSAPARRVAVRDALVTAPDRRQPARDRRQEPAGAARYPRQPPPRKHQHRLRPGRDPVRRPQPPMWAAHAQLGGSRAAITSPSALRSAPIRLATKFAAAHLADRSARGQPPFISSPARADRLRDPRHPRSVPARPRRARTLCRACACPVSRIENREDRDPAHRDRFSLLQKVTPD